MLGVVNDKFGHRKGVAITLADFKCFEIGEENKNINARSLVTPNKITVSVSVLLRL
jgi:hypothetical protein